jgi:hypothetical protein
MGGILGAVLGLRMDSSRVRWYPLRTSEDREKSERISENEILQTQDVIERGFMAVMFELGQDEERDYSTARPAVLFSGIVLGCLIGWVVGKSILQVNHGHGNERPGVGLRGAPSVIGDRIPRE